ncbi:DUF5000 domain-containing lipoprotein [Limibacterium fermenti]|uniref:DUF5000 domain-containing lipoprotein n=1 Tax=Limibacterium fermenti TaxID=3229863 RepID=UPI003A5DB690
MKKYYFYLLILSCVVFLFSCQYNDNIYIDYADPNLPAPAQVTDPVITAIAGGAYITYKIPQDKNLRYVKAVYETQPGKSYEVKSSIFSDTLKIEGYGDTQTRDVKIVSVGKNEKESEPLIVKVTPLRPAISSVYETLQLDPTFGGINIKLKNPGRANLAIVLIADTINNGDWAEIHTFYSSADNGNFSLRGLDTIPSKFGVYLRDRWYNKTDTIMNLITPWYEELIDKGSWKPLYLPGDDYKYIETYQLPRLWDNQYGYNLFASDKALLPQTITWDLGEQVTLSRMKSWHHPADPYNGPSVKEFEIWGTNEYHADGDYVSGGEKGIYTDNWQLLGKFKSYKPSGSPIGTVTAEDRDYALNKGEDFEFEAGLPAVRYIRLKTTETWGIPTGIAQVVMQEVTFWGQAKNK